MPNEVDWRYPLLMLAAIVLGAVWLRRSQARLPLTNVQRIGIAAAAFCGAMIGAKLPFVLSDWDGLRSGTAWFAHGKTIMAGIVGGYFAVELAKWLLDVKVKTGDSFAAPVAAAVAIGRIACFQAGCCFGSETELPWGVCFATAPDHGAVLRHPTQLYEAAFHFSAAILIVSLQSKPWGRGQWMKFYLMSYFVFRFATEFIRPEPEFIAGLTAYQWAALVLLPLFGGLWWRDRAAMFDATAQPQTVRAVGEK